MEVFYSVTMHIRRLIAAFTVIVLVGAAATAWLWIAPGGKAILEQMMGDTPRHKVAAYLAAIHRGDEGAAFGVWQLPTLVDEERVRQLAERRRRVTASLMARAVRSDFTVISIEWWGTCCEPNVTDDPRGAGGARMQVRLVDGSGAPLTYTFDVFVRDLPYWGDAMGYPLRHWVIRDVYAEPDQPLFWTLAATRGTQ